MDQHRIVASDPLTDGIDLERRWELLSFGPVFTADAGVVESSAEGLRVRSPGINDTTGDPAFEPAPDLGNHLKWVTQRAESSSAGFPGLDVPATGALSYHLELGAQVFGARLHPFGDLVRDPDSDFRLGAGVMNVMDFETGIVFDFWVTNTAIHPFYERIPRDEPFASAQAFTSVFPSVSREPNSVHALEISWDAGARVARWLVDGHEVGRVARLGHPDPQAMVVLDHGGTPEDAAPRQLVAGFGIMTLLDGALPPSETGLRDLGEHNAFPTQFAGGSDAFGQGVAILARNYRAEITVAR